MRRREGVAVIAVLLASRVGRQRSEMVIEGQLPGWTEDKLLRHALFEGVRHDKPASEVQRVSLESTTSHIGLSRRPPAPLAASVSSGGTNASPSALIRQVPCRKDQIASGWIWSGTCCASHASLRRVCLVTNGGHHEDV